ncbi:bifunctional diaminohydroxyphosphoribosylaminopyrimidine deaminase/5-amino-6-(5-phosphoribosylamino)uracil reductase RibD [Ideonella sp. YS5]|uniref:bifunctional diaminohydroxyphosphoribosylaminopyrimidine deaminase/5-amino-6-(5-phosphoribosylamino)uracil reductase RibD n=1 Tax=Ideonella sp. YS5 TaxID=3453714 RepID=UPI003EEB0B2E
MTQPPPHSSDPMQHALALAECAIGVTEPNPRVGCVLVAADGRWIGEGHTQAAGSAHAEVMALRDAAARGHDTHGATAYVTLEPCSHHGRTPPCCDALVAASVARVVVAAGDPNPAVNGQGVERLRAAGITVDWAGDAAAEASRELNMGFFSRMQRGRPWVRMKIAASLDGRTALDNGASQWITGEAARHDGHAWRRRAAALLTGSGTVLSDDPRLDVRGHPIQMQPLRIVVDSQLATPPDARLFEAAAPLLFVAAKPDEARAVPLRVQGAEIVFLPGADGHVDLDALLSELARRDINELHVEAGARLNAALLSAGWVDELLVYQAPMLVGPGRGMAALPALETLEGAQRFRFHRVDRVGEDLRLLLRR